MRYDEKNSSIELIRWKDIWSCSKINISLKNILNIINYKAISVNVEYLKNRMMRNIISLTFSYSTNDQI
jgi:hypothetical protein